jgi:type IV conjugative transfer system protein TraE
MNFKAYRNQVSNLFTQNRLLKFVIVVLAVLIIWLTFAFMRASNNRTTIIIPKGLDKVVTMQGGEFDTQYLTVMGSFVSQLYWNFNPAHVVGQYQQLATLLAPEVFPALSTNLFAISEAHERNEVTMTYLVSDIQTELQPNRVITVKGTQTKYILGNRVSGGEQTLRIGYATKSGRFQVLSIEEVKK